MPQIKEVEERLKQISLDTKAKAEIDLSMFYHPDTEKELVSLKHYLNEQKKINQEDHIDSWIRMVATNRLTGHSRGFFQYIHYHQIKPQVQNDKLRLIKGETKNLNTET